MKIEDRSAIVDKIHKMRMQTYESHGRADIALVKPNLPSLHEKEKMIEQYFQAKRKLTDLTKLEIAAKKMTETSLFDIESKEFDAIKMTPIIHK